MSYIVSSSNLAVSFVVVAAAAAAALAGSITFPTPLLLRKAALLRLLNPQTLNPKP